MAGFKFFSTAFAGQFERLADRVFTGLNHLIAFPALDPMPVQGCLPLFFLRHQLRGREVESPDKFQIDVYLLRPVTVYLFWGVDDDPLNKLVYHRRGQFRNWLFYTSPSPRDPTRDRMPSSVCKKNKN